MPYVGASGGLILAFAGHWQASGSCSWLADPEIRFVTMGCMAGLRFTFGGPSADK